MNNLWKKESNRSDDCYVDLFVSSQENKWQQFQLDLQVELLKTHQFGKDNQRSTELRTQGNQLFHSRKWFDAMMCYNESLRFAEVGTENVTLAYANRSMCFFHMRLYDEVLVDIEHATNSNLPDRLKSKLEEYKQLSLQRKKSKDPIKPLELSYNANENFPCMAEVIEIRCDDEFGRHLVATCDIPVGKIVLVEEHFAESRIYEIVPKCYTCFRALKNPVPCTQCISVQFCSIDCMNRNPTHKWECGTFFAKLELDEIFMIKTVLLAIETFGSVNNLMEFVEKALLEDPSKLPESLHDSKSKYHFFFKLKALPKAKEYGVLYRIYKYIMAIPRIEALFETEEKKRFLLHLIVHHYRVRSTNAFGDDNKVSIINVASLLNHSCGPNLFQLYYENKNFFLTFRPIKSGEQLCLSYIDLDLSTEERQEKLKSHWDFICQCERCNPNDKPIDQRITLLDPCFKFVLESYGKREDSSIVAENCIQFLNKYGHSQWSTEIHFMLDVYESTC